VPEGAADRTDGVEHPHGDGMPPHLADGRAGKVNRDVRAVPVKAAVDGLSAGQRRAELGQDGEVQVVQVGAVGPVERCGGVQGHDGPGGEVVPVVVEVEVAAPRRFSDGV
jgi:hypothetical protein